MADVSRIGEIVDASAAVAAAYIPGVQAAYGVGTGLVTVPAGGIQTGQLITALPGNVVEPGTHWSFPASFTSKAFSGTVEEMTWLIEMRFYVNRADLATAVSQLGRIGPLYRTAFSQHVQLLATITSGSALIIGGRFVYPPDSSEAWIGYTLNAVERLDLSNAP